MQSHSRPHSPQSTLQTPGLSQAETHNIGQNHRTINSSKLTSSEFPSLEQTSYSTFEPQKQLQLQTPKALQLLHRNHDSTSGQTSNIPQHHPTGSTTSLPFTLLHHTTGPLHVSLPITQPPLLLVACCCVEITKATHHGEPLTARNPPCRQLSSSTPLTSHSNEVVTETRSMLETDCHQHPQTTFAFTDCTAHAKA